MPSVPIQPPTTIQPLSFMFGNLSTPDAHQQQPVHSGTLGLAPAAS